MNEQEQEQEILKEVISLRGVVCRTWENYTFEYADISKEEVLRQMKLAWSKMKFKPPLENPQ